MELLESLERILHSNIVFPPDLVLHGCVISLSLRKLTKKFGAIAAVDQANLDVNAGEFMVIVGESGLWQRPPRCDSSPDSNPQTAARFSSAAFGQRRSRR